MLLDFDLASLYGVTTGNLNKAVKRNAERFPADFMFQLKGEEWENLIFQLGRSSWGGRRTLPYAFTEQGVAMLSSVLRSERAVKVNIAIMRAFVKPRATLEANRELARKFADLEKRVGEHDSEIAAIIDAIRQLMAPPEKLGASLLIFATLAVGLYPKLLLDRIIPAVETMRFLQP